MFSYNDRHYTHSEYIKFCRDEYPCCHDLFNPKTRKAHTFKEKLLYSPARLVKQLRKPSVINSIPKSIYFLKKIKCFNSWSGKNFTKQ